LNNFYKSIITKFLILLIFSAQEDFANNSRNSYENFYHHFENITVDNNFSIEVNNYTIKRDIGEFSFSNGTFYFSKPFNERIYSAVFIGDGTFIYKPPNEIEEQQLYRFFNKRTLSEKFQKIFFLFTDSTFFEIKHQFQAFGKGQFSEANKIFSKSIEYFRDDEYKMIDPNFTTILLDNKFKRYFSAQFEIKENDGWFDKNTRLFYTVNPFEKEDITLSKGEDRFKRYWTEVVNKFQSKINKQDINKNFHEKIIDITKYDIECNISSGLDFSAKTIINFSPLIKKQKWIYFTLFEELEIDSIFWSTGEKALYTRFEDSWQLWVKQQDSLKTIRNQSLTIFYHGDLLDKEMGIWIKMKSPTQWYPRSGIQKSNYFLTYHFPAKMKLASTGEKHFQSETDEIITSKWSSRKIRYNASFNIGSYREFVVKNDTIPNVIIYQNKTKGFGFNRNMDEEVGGDIVNSLTFFQHLYGKIDLKNLYVCEHPFSHGQAFPGLLNLAWSTFAETDNYGRDEVFRAHEVAHQWWGIGVGYKSYHDKWLSEAFAEYSGLWYMQIILNDNKKFFSLLKNWKENIISNRQYLFDSGQEAGPIWLGSRTESQETEGDYSLIIYKKGAWVIHMLRNMLLDLKTMNEDKFKNMMRDFFRKYQGKNASTEDFKKICDNHFGIDMQWFFNQWVYNTDIPKYNFTYNYSKTMDDKYLVKCKVNQNGVPSNFIMYVPILVEFSENRFVRLRVKITNSISEFSLPLLPLEPQKIIFNDLSSVLCEVDYSDWE